MPSPAARTDRTVPRITLTMTEAAEALGMSVDSFQRHVRDEVREVRRGNLRLYPVRELQEWADRDAEQVLEVHS